MQRDFVHFDPEGGQLVGFLVTVPVFPADCSFMDVHLFHVRWYPLDSQGPGRSHLESFYGPTVQVRVLPMRDQPAID
eukprot:9905086-Heterocapsa_arctica.AAC.1